VGSHRADRNQPHAHAHGHGHSHGTGDTEFEVPPLPRAVLLAVLAAVAVATVVGVVLLWPDQHRADELKGSVGFAAEGVTFPEATVDKVLPVCPQDGPDSEPDTSTPCGQIRATVADGVDQGTKVTVDVPPEVSSAGLTPDDRLVLRTIGSSCCAPRAPRGSRPLSATSRSNGRPRSGWSPACSHSSSSPSPGCAD